MTETTVDSVVRERRFIESRVSGKVQQPEWTPPHATITPTERVWMETRGPWEYQLYDENGVLVWNMDLAKRYRAELMAFQKGDFRQKGYKHGRGRSRGR